MPRPGRHWPQFPWHPPGNPPLCSMHQPRPQGLPLWRLSINKLIILIKRQGEFWANTGCCEVNSAKILKHLSTLLLKSVAARQWVQTLWGNGLPRAQLDSGGHSSSLSPRAQGQTNPHGAVSLLQRSLSCLEALAVAGWLLVPPPAPVHHGQGIMELSMCRILLWITLKTEGNKKENLSFPVSEWFLSVHQVWKKKANPLFQKIWTLNNSFSEPFAEINPNEQIGLKWSVSKVTSGKLHLATL